MANRLLVSPIRPGVANATPVEVAVFNEEAVAYSALHAVTREETEKLQTLLTRKLDGWSSLSDDEYVAHLRKQEDRAQGSAGSRPDCPARQRRKERRALGGTMQLRRAFSHLSS